MTHRLFDAHRETLDKACAAIRDRSFFSVFPEVPSGKIYGEAARDDGLAAFQARLNTPFRLRSSDAGSLVGAEESPYGIDLGITYESVGVDQLVSEAGEAMRAWSQAEVQTRVGICMEMLKRINERSFEIAFATMHTTGQGFMMAFQAGGPHAQDRALEAIAYAYDDMNRTPRHTTWSKRVSKTDTVTLDKTFRIVPRGVAAVIACSTFPTWNSYPGLFASLVTGNAVIIKPHPGAILPLAITAEVIRQTLQEEGFDPNLVSLAPDTSDAPITRELVRHPDVRIIDYTGGTEFGDWIEANAPHAVVFTEKAGVNSVVLDSVDNLKAVTGNLAFSLCLYSGQMCTTPQNIFIPRDGIETGEGHKSFDEVAAALVKAVDWLLSDATRGAEILGAVQNPRTADRIAEAAGEGAEVLRESSPVENAVFPEARVCSPLMLKTDATDESAFMREMFGPIAYIVATDSTEQGIELASRAARDLGAITFAVYSTDEQVLTLAEDAAARGGVSLSCNLTGAIWVNQNAAFSDFHVTGANPSGNATLTDTAFVASRYRIVQTRVPVPTPAAVEV